MNSKLSRYHGYRFPPLIISQAVWLYHRFCLSLRDVEDLMAERGVVISHETVRQWCRKFGPDYVRDIRRRQPSSASTWPCWITRSAAGMTWMSRSPQSPSRLRTDPWSSVCVASEVSTRWQR